MEDVVKDAILTDSFTDLVLLRLAELTVSSIRSKQPLFRNLLEEPAFYRKYFRGWVEEALDEVDLTRKQEQRSETFEDE